MRIAFFTENGYAGGLDTFLTNLINHWPNPEDELVLICNRSHPGLEIVARNLTRPCRVVAHRVPLLWALLRRFSWLPAVVRRPLSPCLKYAFFLSYLVQTALILRHERPERLMVVNGGYPGGDTCRAATIVWGALFDRNGAVHNIHNLSFPPRWWERPVENLIDRLVERYTLRFVAPSRACAETLRLRPALARSDRIGHIYNGTDDPPVLDRNRRRIKDILGIPADSPVVSMLGTYEPRKGHAFLLDAFARVVARVPSAHLVITGYGTEDEVARVHRLVAERGLGRCVHVEGFWIDKHELMEETDVVVVSSQGFESFGLTLVEAMSHGVPVVTTRVGGTAEVVDDDVPGFAVEAHDLDGFAEAIVALLENETLRRIKGEGGRRRFRERFTIARMADDYARLLRQPYPFVAAPGRCEGKDAR